MKYYKKISIISSIEKDSFADKLTFEIQDIQDEGLEVEVQYSSHYINNYNFGTNYTALVMGYKEY